MTTPTDDALARIRTLADVSSKLHWHESGGGTWSAYNAETHEAVLDIFYQHASLVDIIEDLPELVPALADALASANVRAAELEAALREIRWLCRSWLAVGAGRYEGHGDYVRPEFAGYEEVLDIIDPPGSGNADGGDHNHFAEYADYLRSHKNEPLPRPPQTSFGVWLAEKFGAEQTFSVLDAPSAPGEADAGA